MQVKSGLVLTVMGALGVSFQTWSLRKTNAATALKQAHREWLTNALGLACIVCIGLASSTSLGQFALLFLGILTPCMCTLLCSCTYLMGTTATPHDRRAFTIVLEVAILLLTQWLAPMLLGFVLGDHIFLTFPLFAGTFGIGCVASRVAAATTPVVVSYSGLHDDSKAHMLHAVDSIETSDAV